jgi:hypothetical protein
MRERVRDRCHKGAGQPGGRGWCWCSDRTWARRVATSTGAVGPFLRVWLLRLSTRPDGGPQLFELFGDRLDLGEQVLVGGKDVLLGFCVFYFTGRRRSRALDGMRRR